jgi:sugar phosphate isomerase/epimerase
LSATRGPADDSFTVRFRMKGGLEGVIQSSAGAWGPPLDIARVCGSEGTLWVEGGMVRFAGRIAHTLADTVMLAEMAGVGVCIDLQPCWGEANLVRLFRHAMPITGLVQVSDYVLGDRVAPCRAVPGDGAVPLESLIGDLLDAGYTGLFDLELVGPRIDAEGGAAASTRAVERLAEILTRLGV